MGVRSLGLVLFCCLGCGSRVFTAPDSGDASDATFEPSDGTAIDAGGDHLDEAKVDGDTGTPCLPPDPTDGAVDTLESYWGRCNPLCVSNQFCIGRGPWDLMDVDAGDYMGVGDRLYCDGCHFLPPACASTSTCECLTANLPKNTCGRNRMFQCRVIDGRLHLRCGDCPCPQ